MNSYPPPYVSTWELIVTLRRVQHRVEVAMDQSLEHVHTTFAQYRVLEVVASSNGIHVAEIARRIRVTRQAASVSVEKVRLLGLVDVEDAGYFKWVRISERGRRWLELLRNTVASVPQEIEEALDSGQRAQLAALLRRIDRTVKPPNSAAWWLDD